MYFAKRKKNSVEKKGKSLVEKRMNEEIDCNCHFPVSFIDASELHFSDSLTREQIKETAN
jgi:hypothetical protein